MDQLVPLVVVAAGETDAPSVTLGRLIKVIEAIGRRSTYLVLLIENPTALSQLTRLCAASPWIANWISQNPVLLDELLDPVRLYAPPSSVELEQELRQRLLDVEADDLELQMEVLREFRHGHELRVAAADIGPGMAPEQVGVHLARIAEVVLRLSLETAHQGLVAKHGEPTCRGEGSLTTPGFTIIGYGKLGSLELGYGSDLDMIFLFETCESGGTTTGPRQVPHEVFFARLGQRLIHILTTRTRAGLLYEVDMRLRPSGRAGPLVTSLAAFGEYQRHQAWTWEHQALVRARALAGKHELCQAFARIRRELLCTRRDPAHLRQDVVQMRNKMLAAQPHHDAALIDVKHGRGGIVDIEFMVQYWVLLQAADHPELAEHTDNIGILQALADAGLLSTEWSELLVSAYRQYLSTEHRLKLTEGGLLVEHRELAGLADAVVCVWGQVFEQSSGSD
jgi:glutamate-ammonia-ligase adenylyltransferase